MVSGELFDAYYYAHGCGAPYARTPAYLNFFEQVAERISSAIAPATVLDAGCAWGFLVESLRKRGVEAWGIDISNYAIQNVHPDVQAYCSVGSVTEALSRRYDLIVSIEVLEHMQPEEAVAAISNLCAHTEDILFSSTPYDYKEITHFNVQPPEVWAEIFARYGFFRDVDFDASFVTPWAVRFRRRADPPGRIVRDYERRQWLLAKENSDLRALAQELRTQLSAQQQTHTLELNRQAEELEALRLQVKDYQEGAVWKLVRSLPAVRLRLAPPGSRREGWLKRVKIKK